MGKLRLRFSPLLFSIFVIGLFVLFIKPISAEAATYYVDATGGNDNNNGTTTATAWKTLTKVNLALDAASTIQPGDTILFKRGETFAGFIDVDTSGTAGNIITFDAYGSGAKPIIDANTILHGIDLRNGMNYLTFANLQVHRPTGNGFLFFNGATNITLSDITITSTGVGLNISTGTFSNINITNLAASSLSRGIVASTFTSLTNMTIDQSTFNSSTLYGIFINNTGTASNVTISNSTIDGGGDRGIYLGAVNNVTISDTVVSSNNSNGIDIYGGGSNIALTRVTANSNAASGISLNNLSNVTINNSTFNNNTGNGVSLANTGSNATVTNTTSSFNLQDGFNIHGAWTNVIFDTCIAEQNGVDGQNGDGDGFSYHETSSGTIKYSIAKNNIKTAMAHVQTSSVAMEYNILSHTTNGTLPLVYIEGGTYTLYNNVIFSGGQTGIGVQLASTSGNLTIKNSIINGFGTGIDKYQGTINNDYNIIFGAGSNNYNNVSAGPHSMSVNPQFINPSENNFTPTVSSPAINAGVDLGLTRDFAGNTVPQQTFPDIGAYEYVPGSSNSNSSNSGSSNSTPTCTSAMPQNAPQLFQINTTNKNATLFFAPSGNNTTSYAISYGYNNSANQFGVEFDSSNTSAAISYTINELQPNQTYYFQVRGINNCMPGNWSNTLKATTLLKNNSLGIKIFTAWEQMKDVAMSWVN